MLSRLMFLVLLLAPLGAAGAERRNESGLPLFQNFAPRDYRAQNQTWASVQDADGVMYFGNRGCIISYDGTQWSTLPVPASLFVRGLALASDRRLYVGGVNQLGYFTLPAGPGGERRFVSLLDKLPADQREFHEIWSVSVLADGSVCFLTTDQLLVWRDGQFTVLPVSNNTFGHPDALFTLDDTTQHLSEFNGREFKVLSTDPILKTLRLEFILPETDGSWLIGSRTQGLFRLIGGAVTPIPTGIDPFLTSEGLRAGRRLSDGSLALSTRQSGVVLLDRDYRLLCRLDNQNALPSTIVRTFTPDREGGLWLSHNNGLTRLEWPSALSLYTKLNGLGSDLIQDIVRHDGTLYAITSNGAFYLSTESDPAPNPMFKPILSDATHAPVRGGFRGLLSTPHGLLIGNENAVYAVQGSMAKKVFEPSAPIITMALSPSDPTCVYLGLSRGLHRIHLRDGAWTSVGQYPGIPGDVRSVMEADDGTLWGSVASRGFFRIENAANPAEAKVETIVDGHGLPESLAGAFVYVNTRRGQPLFSTARGLFTFDTRRDVFTPLTAVGPRLNDYNLATQGLGDPDHIWLRTYAKEPGAGQWHNRRIWRAKVGGEWQALPYAAADVVDDSRIFREEHDGNRHVLWIPGTEVLLRVDLNANPFRSLPLATPLLHATDFAASETLPFARNTVSFRYVSPSYRIRNQVEYEVQLIGFEAAPHPWSTARETTFTNLSEGNYTFRVRARNADDLVSGFAEMSFTILPPWWRTLWARLGYIIVLVAGIAGLVRWRVAALRRRNEHLEQVVAARTAQLKANEEHLLQARDNAETASRAKSAFLANMSHELRTPLNAILGYARMLHQDEALPATSRQRASVINESGSHLLQVINDVLDLSKIEAGKLVLHPAPFALAHLLQGAAATFRSLAFEKALQLKIDFASDLPATVIADEHRLRQVLFNLLGNALKFTPGGAITFSVRPVGEKVRFTVADTGIGISPEQLRAIFLPFHQAHSAAYSQQGTGLGLTISQRIVELMGGTLEVESKVGSGSRFWFDVKLESTALLPKEEAFTLTGYTGPRRRLLIVDDEAVNRDVLRGFLQPLGFEIHEARDGNACVDMIPTLRPHAVLLDLRMPGLDGFATARRLRAIPGNETLPIIAVSASVFEDNRQEAIIAGCNDFLPKPIPLERTLAVLKKLLNLEWTQRDEPLPVEDFSTPPAALIDELYHLSLSGEVEQLRTRLAEIAASSPEHAAFAHALDGLAARFQMKRIRELLLAQKNRSA